MARLIPESLPNGTPASELHVFESFSRLGDSWTVMWNVPVGLFGKPTATLRQIDFLLIHEHQGILVVEVKGGAIRVERGQWWTQPRGSTEWKKLARSPFDQAADQRFVLQRYLTEKFKIDRRALAHAVAFPATIVPGDLGPDAPRGLIIDLEDLRQPAAAIQRVRHEWGECDALRAEALEKIVAELKPTFTLNVVSAAVAADTTEALERETRRQATMVQSQVEAYKTLLAADRAVVLGGAGTGKTVIAAQLAEQLSSTGNRTLLLCHRSAVQAFLHTLLAIRPARRSFDPDSDEQLHVTAWPGLAKVIAERLGMSSVNPRSPALAEQFLDYRDSTRLLFDAIVIDEGQEFKLGQVEALEWLLTEPEESPMYLFADPFQYSGLFGGGPQRLRGKSKIRYRWKSPLEGQVIALSTNCRNSSAIAELSARFYPYSAPTATVQGPPPVFHKVASSSVLSETVNLAKQLVTAEGFQRNQLLVIPIGIPQQDIEQAAQRAGHHIALINQIFRFPLTPKDLRIPCGPPNDVQGLEADVIVVAYLHTEENLGADREIYIATSRARSLLHMVSNLSEADIIALAARYAEKAKEFGLTPDEVIDDDD